MTKQCFKCRETKLLSEFYAHPQMRDGHLGKCKTCAKRDVAERAGRLGNNPEWLAKERERCRKKQERYRRLGLAKATTPESRKRWEEKNWGKVIAHRLSSQVVKRGEIIKPKRCNRCKKMKPLEKHHEDYSRPFDVEWLCAKCHGKTRWKDSSPTPAF